MNDELEIEVFRAGDYGPKGAWARDQLDALAADYDPARHEAPVTLDHAQQGPALGWVGGLRRVGDSLLARLRRLNGRLLELLRQGAYKHRSVELYPAFGERGRPYLRAVSFLGAAAPAVKGMADPLPAAGDAPLFADEPETEALRFSLEPAPPADPTPGFSELCAELRRDGRWQPAWEAAGIEAFYDNLRGLAAADGAPAPAAWFAGFLRGLPGVVALDEQAPASGGERFAEDPAWSVADGVSAESIRLHRAAAAYCRAHPGADYAEALTRCAG